ncbi:hypothetical protein [Paenibacillus sedimenti]|uniref:Uncharacterized protein n=1 Tax=Paenibacillus sedimenti TaxID=2770274 RepID=A0A926KX01_9BACL|nr:hypothetical protein [Paenibacillus sedimenti]MBD0384691.1 hypothetical protein [Paenibacillus sedimenti]
MNLHLLEPEVAGGLGENTSFTNQGEVEFLHYEFQGWLGDELLESTPCFIVTESMANSIQIANLSGAVFEDIEYTATQEFSELYPNRTLPNFKRLVVLGKVRVQSDAFYEWSGDDFCLTDESYLVVTNNAFDILKVRQLNYCDTKKLSASESY